MKILDINEKEVSIRILASRYAVGRNYRSKLQRLTAEKLAEVYPYEQILEDWTIPGSRMSVDFFLPRLKIVCEVNGKQHIEYNSFHHGQRAEGKFVKQKNRDFLKKRWSEINGFKFIDIYTAKDLNDIG